MAKTKKLPNKLSALMRVALNDLAKVERSSQYEVDMDTWGCVKDQQGRQSILKDGEYIPVIEGVVKFSEVPKHLKCEVCFEGAVMAKTLDCSLEDGFVAFRHDHKVKNKMFALDYVRVGAVPAALYQIDVGLNKIRKYEDEYGNCLPSLYRLDPKQWRKDMWKIVRQLEKEGL